MPKDVNDLAVEALGEFFYLSTSKCVGHDVLECADCRKKAAVRLEQKMLIHSITPADMMKHIK